MLTWATGILNFQNLLHSRAWIAKRIIGDHYSAISSHLASFINLGTVMTCHVIRRYTRSIERAVNTAVVINVLISTIKYAIDIYECLIWARQIGLHQFAGW